MSARFRVGLGGKILAATLSSLLPLLAVILLLDHLAQRGLSQAAQEELAHIAADLKGMCQAQQELLQQKVDSDMKVAQHALQQASGGWPLGLSQTESIDWEAVNQISNEKVKVKLPALQAGPQSLSGDYTVVDLVKNLVGSACTIFQRMNPEGDLLLVSTNVMKADKTRAAGTFIPRTSPVAQSIIKDQPYRGRAFVVNGWYITAYHPLKDSQGQVVGGLFVGVPEQSTQSLIEAIKRVKINASGFAFVMNGEGELIVHPQAMGQKVLETADASGRKVYAELARALKTEGEEPGRAVMSEPGGRQIMITYAAFKPWDWVIAVAAYEDELLAAVHEMSWWAWGIMAVAVLLLAPGGWLLARALSRPVTRSIKVLTEGAGQISDSARTLSANAQSLATGSSQQAASLEETSSSLEEMASMTRNTAANAQQADAAMAEAAERVRQAGQDMTQVAGSMAQIAEAGGQISKIVKSIDEIAFQTNLLALNAAVEAARAGEAGAGFAVVAGEVRNLSMRAAEAAKNTQGLIEETVNRINQGARLVDKTAEGFGLVGEVSGKAAALVHQISEASAEQAQGIEQINKALTHMDEVVQRNAAQAEEAAAASSQMSGQAGQLHQVVEDLQNLVGGAGAEAGGGQAPGGEGRRLLGLKRTAEED